MSTRKVIFGIICVLNLTACASLGYNHQKARYDAGKDTCGRKYYEPYVGQIYDGIVLKRPLPEKYELRLIDQREESVVITNLVYRRVNVVVNRQGVVEKVDCG